MFELRKNTNRKKIALFSCFDIWNVRNVHVFSIHDGWKRTHEMTKNNGECQHSHCRRCKVVIFVQFNWRLLHLIYSLLSSSPPLILYHTGFSSPIICYWNVPDVDFFEKTKIETLFNLWRNFMIRSKPPLKFDATLKLSDAIDVATIHVRHR